MRSSSRSTIKTMSADSWSSDNRCKSTSNCGTPANDRSVNCIEPSLSEMACNDDVFIVSQMKCQFTQIFSTLLLFLWKSRSLQEKNRRFVTRNLHWEWKMSKNSLFHSLYLFHMQFSFGNIKLIHLIYQSYKKHSRSIQFSWNSPKTKFKGEITASVNVKSID